MGPPLLAIVGPTAAGKSGLAMQMAARLDGEIVSADSRQVYRYMDIGTAKPSAGDRSAVPHHVIDVVDPDEDYSLVLFLRHARAAIEDVHRRSKLPILCGGTAQYVWGLLEGWQVPETPPDIGFRRSLERRSEAKGPEALHSELEDLDPDSAARIDPRNVRRVIRALEVAQALGGQATVRKSSPPYDVTIIGVTLERKELYRRIDARVDAMMDAGWVDEVEGLLGRGYGPDLSSMSGVGYRELAHHLAGKMPLEDAVSRTKNRTHRFARSQYAWFRLDDQRIKWYRSSERELAAAVTDFEKSLKSANRPP